MDPTGNTLSGVTRGYGGTTAKAFAAGALACRANTAQDHALFKANILDLATLAYGMTHGSQANVNDGDSINHNLSSTPTTIIVIGLFDPTDPITPYMLPPTVGTKNPTSFTVNLKTNSGQPGNANTIMWMAIL